MVQQYSSPVRVYQYPFEMVMAAYEKRFPTCEMIPAFLGSDITDEYKSDDGAIHIVERRCRLHVDAPYLVRKIAGIDHIICIQRNSLNRRDRTLKIEAWNETFSTKIAIKEHCYYSVHPENSSWTQFEQDASLDITNFFGFEAVVEKIAIKAYTSNLKKGKEIIMYYINELIADGKTYFAPFEGSEGRPRSKTHSENQLLFKDIQEPNENSNAKALSEELSEPKSDEVTFPIEAAEDTANTGITADSDRILKIVEPPPVQEFKLDESYIARYLGQLTTKEETGLMQLRKHFQAMHFEKPPNESFLLRFLRARDANVDKALEMLKNSLHWRRMHHVDNILETWKPPDNLLEYYPGGWHHHDKDGRPVYIVRLGSMDVKGLLKTVGEDGFVKQVVSINEEGLVKCAEAADIFRKPITNWTLIVDLDKLNMRHLWRPGIRALLKIIEIVEINYPETMGQLLIVRAPKVFGVLWTLLSTFIDENTRKKFMIYTGVDYHGTGGLVDYIPRECIPTFLNGPCECDIKAGKQVPKSFYKYGHVGELAESNWIGKDLYQTALIIKGTPYYVSLPVSEAEAVITWDFDVIEGDCVFQVLRHKRPREASTTNITCLGEAAAAISRFSIRPGIDAQVVEKPITCNQGDSLQGTHICQKPGLYILEWKYSNPTLSRQPLKFHNKVKIMYYHELLPSQDFRGSMSSMNSSTSGFSQLSITPSIQNFAASANTSTASQSSSSTM